MSKDPSMLGKLWNLKNNPIFVKVAAENFKIDRFLLRSFQVIQIRYLRCWGSMEVVGRFMVLEILNLQSVKMLLAATLVIPVAVSLWQRKKGVLNCSMINIDK